MKKKRALKIADRICRYCQKGIDNEEHLLVCNSKRKVVGSICIGFANGRGFVTHQGEGVCIEKVPAQWTVGANYKDRQ